VARAYFYNYDDLFYYIVKANPFTLADPALIDKDQVLLIPDISGKNNAPTSYTVVSGDTLASIAKAKLGDESYAINIFTTNGQVLKPKWIKTGETVGVPDLNGGPTSKTDTFQAVDTWTTFVTGAYSDQDLETKITNANTNKVDTSLIMPYQVIKFPDLPGAPGLWSPPTCDPGGDPYDPDDPDNLDPLGPGMRAAVR
jgi:LysM repeat protein